MKELILNNINDNINDYEKQNDYRRTMGVYIKASKVAVMVFDRDSVYTNECGELVCSTISGRTMTFPNIYGYNAEAIVKIIDEMKYVDEYWTEYTDEERVNATDPQTVVMKIESIITDKVGYSSDSLIEVSLNGEWVKSEVFWKKTFGTMRKDFRITDDDYVDTTPLEDLWEKVKDYKGTHLFKAVPEARHYTTKLVTSHVEYPFSF